VQQEQDCKHYHIGDTVMLKIPDSAFCRDLRFTLVLTSDNAGCGANYQKLRALALPNTGYSPLEFELERAT
jgi:hypothetical protein